ncbi:MAG: hypothetical protein N838_00320 [Thiohalocapsa sp. PB-PSB1]|jgi:hypothetical protein|nr:MAG: hypothetical protein N838_30720 [Thiohalocapsa sp. PB-PSB1]QQO52043.1 MAG: hypothetical protein N838_00320 [Thiohalocapsa sp. PB-PSB1]
MSMNEFRRLAAGMDHNKQPSADAKLRGVASLRPAVWRWLPVTLPMVSGEIELRKFRRFIFPLVMTAVGAIVLIFGLRTEIGDTQK